ncbi:hypothetical protein CSA37_05225 [Candidatus Fermentibacteria bacterium]|nr:MAG: hypothetical protein CSA37_05225 [Candidatus Fermentibacteria bacterium]
MSNNVRNLTASLWAALILSSIAPGIPWPLGKTGPDSLNSYTLMNTCGEMKQNWKNSQAWAL